MTNEKESTQPMTDEIIKATSDMVLLTQDAPQHEPHVLLVQRADDSDAYPGMWALPGGHWNEREQPAEAAWRELGEETGITRVTVQHEQPGKVMWWPRLIGVYADPDRDPRGRYVSWAYGVIVKQMYPPAAGDDARDARWWPVAAVVRRQLQVAFDHRDIITDTRDALMPNSRISR